MSGKLVEQTHIAFEFVQRLYDEVATLIREVEKLLAEPPNSFLIGRPSGYGISSRSSTGIDAQNVARWLSRQFSVFFAPEDRVEAQKGQTVTALVPELRVLYLRFLLDGYERYLFDGQPLTEPSALFGVLYDVSSPNGKRKKFEYVIGDLEYAEAKLCRSLPVVDIDTAPFKLKGRLQHVALYSLTDATAVGKLLVEPLLAQYREQERA